MKNLRKFATPLTIGTFLIISITGILMFFHASTGLNKVVHEWVGLIMVIAVILHIVLNWRAMTGYFKRPVALTLVGASVVILGLSFMSLGSGEEGAGRPDMVAVQLVTSAPLEELAMLLDQDTGTLMASLADQGYSPVAGQSLSDLAGGDMRAAASLLSGLQN